MPPSAVHLVYAIDMGVLAPCLRRGRGAAVAPCAVGCRAGRGRQRERGGLPRRAVGGGRLPGGCRDRRHVLAVARGDRVGPRVPARDAGAARAPAPADRRTTGRRPSWRPAPARGCAPGRSLRHAVRRGGDPEPVVRVAVPAPPELGRLAEIHIAGTRRSPRREPDSMKHRFFSSTCGAWVTTATPSSMVSGCAHGPRTTGSASSGGRRGTPRRGRRRAGGTRRVGQRHLLDGAVGSQPCLAVVAVDDARAGPRRREPEQRDGPLRVDDLAGDHEHEGPRGRRVLLRDVGKGGGGLAQRGQSVDERGLGDPGEGRVAEGEEGVDLAVEDGGGGDGGGGCGDGDLRVRAGRPGGRSGPWSTRPAAHSSPGSRRRRRLDVRRRAARADRPALAAVGAWVSRRRRRPAPAVGVRPGAARRGSRAPAATG